MLLSAPALAQEGDTERPGPYLGAEISGLFPVSLQEHFETTAADAAEADPSLGATARAGYRIHRNFAAEVQYEYIDGFPAFVEQKANFEVSGWTVTANAKAFWPLDRLHPFVLVGVGVLDSDVEVVAGTDMGAIARAQSLVDTGVVTRWGSGLDIYLNEHVAFTFHVSYLLPFGAQKRLDSVSVSGGLQYRF